MGSPKKTDDHEVTLSLSIVQAVESSTKPLSYYETTRNGKRKRIYESVKPQNHFHLEYQLIPGLNAPIYCTDVVTYDIVSKVFTDHDERVVSTWNEAGLTYYGWRHSHNLKITVQSLLELYEHTLTVRVWNTLDKLSPRAKYDRPKAFRLPALKRHGDDQTEDSDELTNDTQRPDRYAAVNHSIIPTKRSRRGSRRFSQAIECVEGGEDVTSHYPNPEISPRKMPIVKEEQELSPDNWTSHHLSTSAPEAELFSGLRNSKLTGDLTKSGPLYENLSSSDGLKGISRRRLRQLQTEAEEKLRIDNEGIAVLSLKLADLFASRDNISAKLQEGVATLCGLEIHLNLDTPLMSDEQRRALNPMTFTVSRVSNLPVPISQEKLEPAYVKFKFYNEPPVCTPPLPLQSHLVWEHSTVLLLGIIPPELLLEYLRGSPLTLEIHDRDRKKEKDDDMSRAVFGSLWSDQIIGTVAFGKESLRRSSQILKNQYGVSYLDLSTLLEGLRVMEFTLPIMNSLSLEEEMRESLSISAGNYLKYDSQLSLRIELTYSLNYPSLSLTKEMDITTLRPKTPFGRLVFIISVQSCDLVNKVLTLVRDINAIALELDDLPIETRDITLSTYKLTQDQIVSPNCDVITGFHIEDTQRHIIICEGLIEKSIRRLWNELPHHNSQDPGIIKTFYNSDYTFSCRLYGNLDIDLTHIVLPHPLSVIIQQPTLYIRGALPKLCFNALMNINELQLCTELADVVCSNIFPSDVMITALSLYCIQHDTHDTMDETNDLVRSHDEQTSSKMERRRRRMSWQPLNNSNPEYETLLNDQKHQPVTDFIMSNIVKTRDLSEESTKRNEKLKRERKHVRSLSEDDKSTVHLYSSQTYNSTVLGKARLRKQLDPKKRYTYCQQYHSMTVEPVDWIDETKKKDRRGKWRITEGFVYPAPKTSLESNVHPRQPHTSRIEELNIPFVDNELHTNTLKPTVTWLQYSWDKRSLDFERYRSPALDFDVQPCVTIHLAGETRAKEKSEYTRQEQSTWDSKLVVKDTRFHVLRRGLRTEQTSQGPLASSQADKLQGLLKDSPNRYSLVASERLRVDKLPALSIIHSKEEEDKSIVGYHPGPVDTMSFKRDCNVVQILKQTTPPAHLHRDDFNLYCSGHSVHNKMDYPIRKLSSCQEN